LPEKPLQKPEVNEMGNGQHQFSRLVISDQPTKQPDSNGRSKMKIDRFFIYLFNITVTTAIYQPQFPFKKGLPFL
jgi:hypothetical protein